MYPSTFTSQTASVQSEHPQWKSFSLMMTTTAGFFDGEDVGDDVGMDVGEDVGANEGKAVGDDDGSTAVIEICEEEKKKKDKKAMCENFHHHHNVNESFHLPVHDFFFLL